jgi:transposase
MAIMTLCLLVYNIASYKLREALEVNKDTINNQLGKKTNKPSMKYVFKLFLGIEVLKVKMNNMAIKAQEIVLNLKDVHKKIINYFGEKACQIYGLI